MIGGKEDCEQIVTSRAGRLFNTLSRDLATSLILRFNDLIRPRLAMDYTQYKL